MAKDITYYKKPSYSKYKEALSKQDNTPQGRLMKKQLYTVQKGAEVRYARQRAEIQLRQVPSKTQARINRTVQNLRRPAVSNRSANAVTSLIAGRTVSSPTARGTYSRPGRPKGASGKYAIPGVGPVGVYEFRKWQRYQQRMAIMQQQQQLLEAQARGYVPGPANPPQTMRQVTPVMTRQIPMQQAPQVPMQQQYPQQVQPQQPIDDGWGLLRIKSPLTMTAPNNNNLPVDPIGNAQAPVGNKFSAYYSEPDFMSGKQVLKQRPNIGGFGIW